MSNPRGDRLAFIDLPVSLALIAELQQTVFRIVPFAALRTLQIAAPCGSLAIIIFGHGECCPTTAGDKEHLERLGVEGPLRA
jgi:hypothetical protein